ncbi:YezD family protein [Bacillaceae bacterium IKA-2]|nr:YezD family protein [Bacillaceae bacterium IKA-2]
MVNKYNKEHEQVFLKVQEMLKEIKYGSITLVVQDGKVIQIERNEKHRLN